ncbi:MAG TPA: extensin family protein, partial [Rhizobiaceae bacterium]
MGKLSIPRLALAITIFGIFLFPPTTSFAAEKIWLERQVEKLFSPPRQKAQKRRKSRPAQSASRQSGEIRLPATAPLPEAAPPRKGNVPEAAPASRPDTAVPVPGEKPPPPIGETRARDDVHPSDEPLDHALAEPPKPEFRPGQPAPEAVGPRAMEPAEPAPPPDPRSVLRADPSGKLPAGEVACRKRLTELGVRFEEQKSVGETAGCSMAYPLAVKSLGSGIDIEPEAEMNCAMAEAAARFAKDVVSPAAEKAYGQKLKSISHASAYVCRPRAGTQKLSEHAFGNALDIASFTLSGGAVVGVEPHPDA